MRDGFDRSFGDASTLPLRLSGLGDADAERLLDAHAPDLSADLRSRFLKEASGNPWRFWSCRATSGQRTLEIQGGFH